MAQKTERPPGEGYRVYFKEYAGTVVLLLNGGTNSTQQKDIDKARDLWSNYKDELKNGN